DLAKLAQVMLNDGGYGNNKFFDKNTIEEFTKRKASSPTWGLGWWREGENGRVWYFGTQSSSNTIGHQGWTGTLTVIDPESNLVVVLLTNKINSPLIDNKVNANMFYGNKFTTSTLGTVPTLVYESIIHDNDDAIDANVAQMVTENLKLYNPSSYMGEAILQSVYSKVDTAISRAEERTTSTNIAYAEEAVGRLDVENDREQIIKFNERIKNLGGTPVDLPNYSSKLEALNATISECKDVIEKGQDLGEHVHYQTSTWNKFKQAYKNALAVAEKANSANQEELTTATEELETSKNELTKLDKTNLNKIIEDANTRVKEGTLEDLEESVKTSFINALEAAKVVYDNKDASIQDIAKAYNDILVQYKELGIPVGEKNNLADLVNMAEAINLDRFLNKGQEEFKNALKAAKDILAVEDAAEIDIYKAFEALYNSMMNLELKADKAELCIGIADAEKINLSLYIENSGAELLAAIEAAKLVRSNSEASQDEVDNALMNVNNAVKALVKAADKSDLEALVKKADAVDVSKYKAESVETFSKVLNEAKNILEDKNISVDNQELVNTAYNNLNSAIDGLELKGTSNGNAGSGSSNENNDKKDDNDSITDTDNKNNNNDNGGSTTGKGDSNLPTTGGTSPVIYAVIGMISIAIGSVIFKKRTLSKQNK
ncbi:MAG: LPXTG cell wall anchor domain-containing protein, partial [Clostridium sartagoforme]|nr:LPXTG cell wall anchor domain-containing protein [Clostridium sartagoforme]